MPNDAESQITQLEKLSQLKASGAITDAEFEAMKAKILAGAAPGNLSAPAFHPDGVEFADAVRIGFSKYVTFEGRAIRSEYWF